MSALILCERILILVNSSSIPVTRRALCLQRYAQLNRVMSVLLQLFCKAHQDSALSQHFINSHRSFVKKLQSPVAGFLSCNIKKQSDETALAKQVC